CQYPTSAPDDTLGTDPAAANFAKGYLMDSGFNVAPAGSLPLTNPVTGMPDPGTRGSGTVDALGLRHPPPPWPGWAPGATGTAGTWCEIKDPVDTPGGVPSPVGTTVQYAGQTVTSCPMGQTLCSGVCVNGSSDPNNCGGCGINCAVNKPGSACSGGSCQCPA